MSTLLKNLEKRFSEAAKKSLPSFTSPIEVAQSTNDKFGHYQFNSSMKIAKELGQNPRQIAEKILGALDQSGLEKVEIAGPGFINITFNKETLENQLSQPIELPAREKVIVEFSSPNVAKELHVGHLRSTIIGESLARLFEFLGHDVIRLNHIGDWGTQFGMLIAFIKENHPQTLSGKEETDLPQLMKWYKESKVRFDADSDFKKRSQLQVVALQSGDPEALKAWEKICDISRKAYQEIYDLLQVTLEERGESFYNPMLKGVVEELEKKGLVQLSDGAKCIFVEGFKNREGDALPLMVQKSDGAYNYDTTDMAAIKHRIDTVKANRIIYVTDVGQQQHFFMVFKAAVMAGWLDPKKTRVDHVGFGLVLGPDGKKFKTRSGDTEKLIDLLNAGIEQADKILAERSPEMNNEERHKLAKALGLSAIKYSDLSSHRMSDYAFSYDKMLRFEGNTAAFLMYSYVRILGIKRKIGARADELIKNAKLDLNHPSEIALALHLARFSETLKQVEEELLPNRLTDYLYQLAEKFNAFFRDCRVEGSPEEASRLKLADLTLKTMREGFHILGIEPVERM
jgi:arginyl-tRNA synthetase